MPRLNGALPLFFLVFVLVACPSMGQVAQRAVTETDYLRFGDLQVTGARADGKWVSYQMSYENRDTLFVRRADGGRALAFPGGRDGHFFGKAFACRTGDSLAVAEPDKGTVRYIPGCSGFTAGKGFAACITAKAGDTLAMLLNREGRAICTLPGTTAVLSPDGSKLAISGKGGIFYSEAGGPPRQLAAFAEGRAAGMAWGTDGKQLMYAVQYPGDDPRNGRNLRVAGIDGRHHALPQAGVPAGLKIWPPSAGRATVRDGFAAFTVSGEESAENTLVSISGTYGPKPKAPPLVYGWNTGTDEVYPLCDTVFPRCLPAGVPRTALTWSARGQRGNSYYPVAGLYRYGAGGAVKVADSITCDPEKVTASPDGRYFAWAKGESWRIWDTRKGSAQRAAIPGGRAEPAGWEGNALLLYDEYDLWKAPPGGKPERITRGREHGVRYRLVPGENSVRQGYFDGFLFPGIDTGGPLLFSTEDTTTLQRGYAVWQGGKEAFQCGGHASQGILAGGTLFWAEEGFGMPPRIVCRGGGRERLVFQSNAFAENLDMGHSENITYQADGQMLTGSLFYPAGYRPGQRYPMAVVVYESQGDAAGKFARPSLHNFTGVNVANLTAKGYAVLLPSVAYRTGDPGGSALRCTEAAVEAVLAKGIADPARLALCGHSFGGYEAAYIMAKSTLFKTAIIGGAVTDLPCFYLSANAVTGRPEAWRFEEGQFRMGRPLWDDAVGYTAQSPVFLAPGIAAPVLLWCGSEDYQSGAGQTMAFAHALRRLGKAHVVLEYPGEGHVLTGKEAQEDLTRRVEAWLDRFLAPRCEACR